MLCIKSIPLFLIYFLYFVFQYELQDLILEELTYIIEAKRKALKILQMWK